MYAQPFRQANHLDARRNGFDFPADRQLELDNERMAKAIDLLLDEDPHIKSSLPIGFSLRSDQFLEIDMRLLLAEYRGVNLHGFRLDTSATLADVGIDDKGIMKYEPNGQFEARDLGPTVTDVVTVYIRLSDGTQIHRKLQFEVEIVPVNGRRKKKLVDDNSTPNISNKDLPPTERMQRQPSALPVRDDPQEIAQQQNQPPDDEMGQSADSRREGNSTDGFSAPAADASEWDKEQETVFQQSHPGPIALEVQKEADND